MADRSASLQLGQFARAGFQDLSGSRATLIELARAAERAPEELLAIFSAAADPDTALKRISEFASQHPRALRGMDRVKWERFALLVGASPALGSFFTRNPERLEEILLRGGRLHAADELRAELLLAVGVDRGSADAAAPTAGLVSVQGARALRIRYRELLAEIALWDLMRTLDRAAPTVLPDVALALTRLAEAALEAALAVARATLISGESGPAVAAERLALTRLAVIALGKCGAEELNVVSDVDVMFVADALEGAPEPGAAGSAIDHDAALRIATRLATELMRAIQEPGIEPPLWEVDANLRPEGRQGALVRSLASMQSYYERWAKAWEFQALLKARAVAGDLPLGREFIARVTPLIWASATREDFVGSVQRMRERVTEHIREGELDVQLKLGPGGLRDIEFSVQLLQLVHGQHDESLRVAGTLPALEALAAGGYVARTDGEDLAGDYRRLRVIEHRLQLRDLRRTAIMPRDEPELRVLARATGLARTADELTELWEGIKLQVRNLHLKIFYAPLLGAVAALPEGGVALSGDGARTRLSSVGFADPDGALRHLAALTSGNTRSAQIQRTLLPVLLRWIADGTDPDFGLLAFRRVSEANRDAPWYLRLLRDGSAAAERLAHVLSSSRFTADLLESTPEAVAWLERDELMRPLAAQTLIEEMRSLISRRESAEDAAAAVRTVHRREVLRLALGRMTGVIDDDAVAGGLDAAHTALLDSLLLALRADVEPEERASREALEIALIGMGRYGGGELGFASDIDLIAVYRVPEGFDGADAQRGAERLVAELRRLVGDPRFSVDLDFDLRPEGKNGPIVRSLDSYRAYYERWSVTWEAQALLRARWVAGDEALGSAFEELADEIRYPDEFPEASVREVRRIKARVEAERLPQGADPKRHFKLGPGGLSDVEWLVQLLQLRFAAAHGGMRTVSTLGALEAAEAAGVIDGSSGDQLARAWKLAGALRGAMKLWSGRGSDVLPGSRVDLEGIAGVLGMPHGRTREIEEQWFAVSRRARAVVEREFYGYRPDEFGGGSVKIW